MIKSLPGLRLFFILSIASLTSVGVISEVSMLRATCLAASSGHVLIASSLALLSTFWKCSFQRLFLSSTVVSLFPFVSLMTPLFVFRFYPSSLAILRSSCLLPHPAVSSAWFAFLCVQFRLSLLVVFLTSAAFSL